MDYSVPVSIGCEASQISLDRFRSDFRQVRKTSESLHTYRRLKAQEAK